MDPKVALFYKATKMIVEQQPEREEHLWRILVRYCCHLLSKASTDMRRCSVVVQAYTHTAYLTAGKPAQERVSIGTFASGSVSEIVSHVCAHVTRCRMGAPQNPELTACSLAELVLVAVPLPVL